MGDPISLTASQIRYLLTMKDLDHEGIGVRGIKVASALGFSRPSVHTMLNTFREMGLIRKDDYGIARFTDLGLEIVTRYSCYYQSLIRVLAAYFPPDEHLQAAVYAFMAEIPENRLKALACGYQKAARRPN